MDVIADHVCLMLLPSLGRSEIDVGRIYRLDDERESKSVPQQSRCGMRARSPFGQPIKRITKLRHRSSTSI